MTLWSITFKIICQHPWNSQEVWMIIVGIYFTQNISLGSSCFHGNKQKAFYGKFRQNCRFLTRYPQSGNTVTWYLMIYGKSVIFYLSFDVNIPQSCHQFLFPRTFSTHHFPENYHTRAIRTVAATNSASVFKHILFAHDSTKRIGGSLLYQSSHIIARVTNAVLFLQTLKDSHELRCVADWINL